ncbi:hypothetical protein L249_4798 [Ophiocordyceps polyrhachis-furcata BCC 54312]|uniref:Protein kinase domain-containing protein n=1 Tax=Ophiocordyceps polyrhachis-furcata BCC 54312 TaxID=1330021 RepID=A0A367L363_9HYPO|nr:hypothetical protein L249_4798 [Ophiocordyceps polyrhachis-furcata BCC 54312]
MSRPSLLWSKLIIPRPSSSRPFFRFLTSPYCTYTRTFLITPATPPMASKSPSSSSSPKPYKREYGWVDGAEVLERYSEGGYHPVEIGNVLHDRYHIIDKLGYGGWSTVWLARDSVKERYVALKVGRADSLGNETETLRALETAGGCDAIPRLLDQFHVDGPNGSHPCSVTEPALCSLYDCSFSRLFPRDVARALSYELALAVSYLHSHGYAHGDIYLPNVLLKAPSTLNQLSVEQFREKFGKPDIYPVKRLDGNPLPPGVPRTAVVPCYLQKKHVKNFTLSDARILLSDFGEAFAPAAQSRRGADCHSPTDYRPPDAFLQPDIPLSFSSDIWCLALAIWDILGMQPLFGSFFGCPESLVSQVVDVFGPLPSGWWEKWEGRTKYFNDDGTPKAGRHIWSKLDEAFEERVQKQRRELNMGEYGREETAAFLDLMVRMLKPNPQERITMDEVLQSEWMVKWARPEYERSLAARQGT